VTSSSQSVEQNSEQNYWCPQDAVVLTEAETYSVSQLNPSLYVKFDLSKDALQGLPELSKIAREEGAVRTALVVWTTQPWTLPASCGVALRSQSDYVAIKAPTIDGTEIWIVAKELQAVFEKSVGFGDKISIPLLTLKAEQFDRQKVLHPLQGEIEDEVTNHSPVVIFLDGHLSLENGTGVIQIASDYRTGKIDANARSSEKIIENMNEKIIELLQDFGHLAARAEIEQANAYCKRCRHPVVHRGPGSVAEVLR
jgi:isoleucyl-tRNA synthetase